MDGPVKPDMPETSDQIGDNQKGPADLREWLGLIEADGGLKRITAPVSMKEEMSALTYMVAQDEASPALLFETIASEDGEKVPGAQVLSNMLGASRRRFALAVGIDPDLNARDMILAMRERSKKRMCPKNVPSASAPINEIVLTGDDIDLTKLPAPKFWPRDGGDYIGTGDITFTRNPDSGRINVGCYRQMVQGPREVGMYCSPGKHGLLDREAWWARGEPCEVVAAYGIDPVAFMVAAQSYGAETAELDIIGGLTGTPFELTEGVAGSLPIPARAEIVIEGVVHAGETKAEGPLGEFTGYYGRPESPQPVIKVNALHMRRKPILTAALMADYPACEIGAYYAIMRSAAIWDDLERFGIPGIKGIYSHPAAASGWGLVAVSIEQRYAGHTAQVLAAASQCPAAAYFTKWIITVDEDVDPADMNQVVWAMSTRCNPIDDIDFQRKTWSTGLDPSQYLNELRPYGSKALIDACKPHRFIKDFPVRTALRESVYKSAASRWQELGLDGDPPQMSSFDGE